ncbi:MAG: AAA family ATPase [Candidatus Omnitrophica bacterium]|nr:AAA family ATPase [Candidatus Omnitrophota bacterium]MBU4302801.1 AAA family ATPase [Candidatus Omnitrophota bacterium]MBU4418611.1 AAA family ATPase [Candidatus Omnitrophota bacterium]MBU4467146.1 AAA family ATPase [Candidatus Omnitrophota bacterium]MCG2714558.1 AAA family ATPase [Candidatus Omnitrophota bacterium]
MSYFSSLGLIKEPFSNNPNPEFFFESIEHKTALVRLLIEIRLRRGLSVILGDVGVGKTTLSRKLFQMLKERSDILFYMILDPTAQSEELFLESLVRTFNLQDQITGSPSILDYKEVIKKYLYQKGVEENKTIVLVVDEAQKLNGESLEVLRVLLNYETNDYKLLQLVLFSQMELLPKIKEIKNFYDRIVLKYVINPLDEPETRELINFRLHHSGFNTELLLFTNEAVSEIQRYSQGYPRKINLICHNALRNLVTSNKTVVDGVLIRDLIARSIV